MSTKPRPKKKRRRYLTDKGVSRLSPDKTRPFIVTDSGARGLAIKITPLGKRVWILNTVYPGHERQSKRALGEFSSTQNVSWARQRAIECREQVRNGVDPTAAAKEARKQLEAKQRAEALRDQSTFAAYAEKYAAEKTNRRAAKDGHEIRKLLIDSPLGPMPIHAILPADVRSVIDKIKVQSAYQALHAWTFADQIFKMAVHEQLITASPMASLIKRLIFKNVKIVSRQRSLSDDELVAFWRATGRLWRTRKKRWRTDDDAQIGPLAESFYRLSILLATRRNELLRAKRDELHPELRKVLREAAKTGQQVDWASVTDEWKIWTVPEARFKSEVPHTIPLSDHALRIIERIPNTGGPYLLSLDGKKPAAIGSKYKERLDQLMLRTLRALARRRGDETAATVTLPNWCAHDLRRVVRTGLAALRVPDNIAEMCIGHGKKGLERIYNVHHHLPEIREAMQRWADRVMSIVEPQPPAQPANVVSLRKRARAR